MRKNSIKNTRINSEVQRELSEIISREIKDPRIHPMTTVVAVEVTPDLKYCKAYISVLGSEEAGKETIKGLKSAEGFVRRQLASRINLRNTPEITFVLDQSIEYGVNMTHLINEVTKDLDTDEPEADEDDLWGRQCRFTQTAVSGCLTGFEAYTQKGRQERRPFSLSGDEKL